MERNDSAGIIATNGVDLLQNSDYSHYLGGNDVTHIASDFYEIILRGDGLADVFLIPSGTVYRGLDGLREYDVDVRVVRGVKYSEELEGDIRARFEDWCASGEMVGG